MMVKSKVKYIQSLSHKKQRDEAGVFVAEGPKIINELLKAPLVRPEQLFALPEWIATHPEYSAITEEIDAVMLPRISSLSAPNQVLGIFRKIPGGDIPFSGRITLLTDNIQDPGNMGSIIRCADWFGIGQVVCSMDCTDVYGPKTVQASMGSIGRVNVLYRSLPAFIAEYKEISVYSATLDGENVYNTGPLKEGFLVIGNESKGIQEEILRLTKMKITIPRKGNAESLNAAVATGILLSHLVSS